MGAAAVISPEAEAILQRGVEYPTPRVLANSDEPDHTRIRKVAKQEFSPRRFAAMEMITNSEVPIANFTRLMAMFSRGDFGLIALGRSQLINPPWPKPIRRREFSSLRSPNWQIIAKHLDCSAVYQDNSN